MGAQTICHARIRNAFLYIHPAGGRM